jgi:hypothetical protein
MDENTLFVDLLFNKSKIKPLNNSCTSNVLVQEDTDEQCDKLLHSNHQFFVIKDNNDANTICELRKKIKECETKIHGLNNELNLLKDVLNEYITNKGKLD